MSHHAQACLQMFNLFYNAQDRVIKHPEANQSHISALLPYYELCFMQSIYSCSGIYKDAYGDNCNCLILVPFHKVIFVSI